MPLSFLKSFFLQLRFSSLKAEQPLRAMKLQEKVQRLKIQERKCLLRGLLILQLKPFRS